MLRRKAYFILSFILALGISACKKDDPKGNQAPDTQIFLDEINLSGENRLTSQVELFWSGTDADGFVQAYEVSIGGEEWTRTESTDSLFQFNFSANTDTVNIQFYVRAIDNEGLTDKDPAFLEVPIKNSPPEINFTEGLFESDTVYTIFSVQWESSDLDGDESLEAFELKANNGDWIELEEFIEFLTIIPEDPRGLGEIESQLYRDIEFIELQQKLNGLVLNDTNRIYIRARDIAGLNSEVDTSAKFYLKAAEHDLLLVNASKSFPAPMTIFRPALRDLNIQYDYLDLVVGSSRNLPTYWSPTFEALLKIYDKVFLLANESEIGGGLVLELAAEALVEYLNDGGKLFTSCSFPDNLSPTSPVYGFAPMDSLSTADGQARIPTDSLLSPLSSAPGNWPTLICSNFIVGADPFYPVSSATAIYESGVVPVGSWTGPRNSIALVRQGNGNVNQVFSSVELHLFNKDNDALKDLLNRVINEELDW